MKIIILGAGQVGRTAAQHLAREAANDVTVVDTDERLLRDLQDRIDIRTVQGNAASPQTLESAGARDADMIVALNSARAYVYAVARSCDAGKTTRHDAAGAILYASESAVKTSLEAIQALGGAGYTRDFPVERFLRDAKLYDIGAGTNEVRRFLIGREIIGGG